MGFHSAMIQFSTGNPDNLSKITDMVLQKNYRIISYEAKQEWRESHVVYHVTIVIKNRNHSEEGNVFKYIQQLPDLMIEKIE